MNSTSPPAHMWSQDSSSPCEPIHCSVTPLRLVLLGRTGSGKSATGNTILKKTIFPSELSMSSVTKQCQKECGEVEGRSLELIDTPGYFDTSLKDEEITEEQLKCMVMCSPGPHAFLLIIPIARFTEEQQKTVEMIEETFKENISNHTIIIFTRADELEGETIEMFIYKQEQRIQDLISRFGGRFLAFNNKNPENRDQVKQLLEKLDELLEQNQFRHFTNQETQAIQKALEMLEQKEDRALYHKIKWLSGKICFIMLIVVATYYGRRCRWLLPFLANAVPYMYSPELREELSLLLGPCLAGTVITVVTKMTNAMIVANRTAPLMTSLCSIQ